MNITYLKDEELKTIAGGVVQSGDIITRSTYIDFKPLLTPAPQLWQLVNKRASDKAPDVYKVPTLVGL